MFKRILIVIALCIVLIFLFKDYLARNYIERYIKNEFGAECTIEKAQIFITSIEINNLQFQSKDFKGSLARAKIALDLHKFLKLKNIKVVLDEVFFEVSNLRGFKQILQNKYSPGVKDQSKKPLRATPPLHLDLRGIDIKIKDPQKLFLDVSGSLKAVLEGNYLTLEAKEVSFGDIVTLAGGEENFSFQGRFSGELEVFLKDFALSGIEGNFYNSKGGIINIKKETELAFLKKRLDEESYRAIIDNFKNYNYNGGKIKVQRKDHTLSVQLDFDSQDLGRRNITVNFHNLVGGEK